MSINIMAKLDTTDVEAKENVWKARVTKLNYEIDAASAKLKRVVRSAFSAISSTVHAFTSVANAFGIAIPASFQAIFSAVTATVSSLTAIAAAYAAGGVTLPIAVLVEGAAIALSIWGIASALSGQQEAAQAMQRMNTALHSVSSAATGWGRVFGAWGD